jgi:hypothetical protein
MMVPAPAAEDDEYRLSELPAIATEPPISAPGALASATRLPAATRDSSDPSIAARKAGTASDDASSGYFLAGYDRVFQMPKLFRVYPDGDELLFVFAGPFHSSMIAGYQAQYAKAVQRGAVAGLSGGAGGAAIGAGAVAAGMAVDWLAGAVNRSAVADRAEVLDAMDRDALRREVDANKSCFRMSNQNVDSAVIEPPKSSFWSTDDNADVIPAYLRFKHRPTGMWHLQLMTEADVAQAIRCVRQVLAGKEVKVLVPG